MPLRAEQGLYRYVVTSPGNATPDPRLPCSRTMLRSMSRVSGTPSMTLSPSQITPGRPN